MFIDIHSHAIDKPVFGIRVLNLISENSDSDLIGLNIPQQIGLCYSAGIHPWYCEGWNAGNIRKLMPVFEDKNVILLGEIGLDKLCKVPFRIQNELFISQLEIANSLKKPVILHVVKEMENVINLKMNYPEIPEWIIHGFRGGSQEARQYLSKGFSLSFGCKFSEDGLNSCPEDKLFIETDESDINIEEIYIMIAKSRSVRTEDLELQVERNFSLIYKKGLTF